jgi:hypothetical protein
MKNRFTPTAARNGSLHNGEAGHNGKAGQPSETTDDRLESMVNQLLDSEPEPDGEAAADAASTDLLAARNGGSKAASLGEEEIESLIERMIFSERAFLKYSH